MRQGIYVYETGIDDNHDRHCDYCGWYVNEHERHRARLMHFKGVREERPDWSAMDFHLEKLTAEEFSEIFIKGNPYSSPDWDPSKYSSIRAYSDNDPEGISCPAVNKYLRYGILPKGISQQELVSFVEEMNASIVNFTIDKPVTFYRGMHYKPGDAYLDFLDDAYKTMKTTGRPVAFVEKGFMSTSRSLETARTYARCGDSELSHVFISVTLEKGVAAMPLSLSHGTTTKKNDKEVLLESGKTYYIIGMDLEPRENGCCDYFINLLATNRRI